MDFAGHLASHKKLKEHKAANLGKGWSSPPQVRAQVLPLDPELAQTFIQAAQEIIDTLVGGSKAHGKITLVSREAGGTTWLQGEAAETFEFADTYSSLPSIRFYRVVSP